MSCSAAPSSPGGPGAPGPAASTEGCAYCCVLYGDSVDYFLLLMVLARRLQLFGARAPLLVLPTADVPEEYLQAFQRAGCRVLDRAPELRGHPELFQQPQGRHRRVLTKLRVLGLTGLRKVLLIDAHAEWLRERDLRIAELELEAARQRARIEVLEAPPDEGRLRELRDIVQEALVEQRQIIESQSSLLEELNKHLAAAEPGACRAEEEPSRGARTRRARRPRGPRGARAAQARLRLPARAAAAARAAPRGRREGRGGPSGAVGARGDEARARHPARVVELPRLRPTSASRGLRPGLLPEKAAGRAYPYGLARAGADGGAWPPEPPRAGLG
ncbi:unnamed protein product [Prorocentrum cordatum]|uniref:Uncharacterized protein n=1 Tax=Prorocentrum cordatum TaxID=2364126 RepID=A0ABN9SQG0_9DINO|nr:unnamed protein product [Polarella glacialis]